MAELSWNDVLSNTQQFPHDMVMTMEDGTKVTLGTLRQTVHTAYVPQAQHADTQRQAQEQQQALLREKQMLEQELVRQLQTSRQPTAAEQAQVPSLYQTDPLFQPMWNEVGSLKKTVTDLADLLKKSEERQQQMHQTVQQIPVVMQIQKIQASDAEVDPKALLDFAREHHFAPHQLDDAHRLMTRERDLQRAREEGMKAGEEKAKADYSAVPQVPYAPYGVPDAGTPPPPKFESEDALEQAILQDREIYNTYMGIG